MRYENRDMPVTEFLKFTSKSLRRKVQTRVGDILQPIGKRRLDDNRTETFRCMRMSPNLFRGRCIADVQQDLVALLDEIGECWYHVVHANRSDCVLAHPGPFIEAQLTKPHYGNALRMVRQARKIRPDVVVEKILFQPFDDLNRAPDINARCALAVEIVGEHREGEDMVQMNMSDQNIFYTFLSAETQSSGRRAGVEEER